MRDISRVEPDIIAEGVADLLPDLGREGATIAYDGDGIVEKGDRLARQAKPFGPSRLQHVLVFVTFGLDGLAADDRLGAGILLRHV